MNRYRALLAIARYWPAVGGSELHTRELTLHLAPYADVTVLCHNCNGNISNEQASAQARSGYQLDHQVRVFQVGPRGLRRRLLGGLASLHPHTRLVRPLHDVLFAPFCRHNLRCLSQGQDVIHAIYNGMTCIAEQALEVARERDIPYVFTPLAHTHAPEGQGWSSRRFRRLYRQADAVIAMTEYEREWLIARGAHPTRTHVCPVGPLLTDGIDPMGFRMAQGIGHAPLILFIGRHVETKGYRQLALATREIWRHHPTAHFVFVGPQTAASRSFLEGLREPRITWIDHVSDHDKCSALAACDLLCVPSTQESLGVTYLEAWHYAKPVIAADVEVMRALIRDGEDGLLVAPNPDSIASAITRLLGDLALGERLGKAGQANTRFRYAWPHLAAMLASIHASVIGSPAPWRACL